MFHLCSCNGPKRCRSKRCACFKNNVLCNSRCHNSVNCLNKWSMYYVYILHYLNNLHCCDICYYTKHYFWNKHIAYQYNALVTHNTYFIYLNNLHCCDICYRSKRCACLKNNVLCNSRCPNSVNCLNKWSMYYVSPMHYTGKRCACFKNNVLCNSR
jgi:hypothetical protein